MKKLSLIILLLLFPLQPSGSVFAQKALPVVPVTYPGDTAETIIRRAQWIEGAKKESTLVWWFTMVMNQAQQLMTEFNRIYPFIKISYWRGVSEEKASKFEAEYASGRYTVDIMLGGEPYNYPRWRSKGMLAAFTDVTGVDRLDKRVYGRYGDWAIPGNSVMTPVYNAKLISPPSAPKKWEDLLDPKWKGQIGMSTSMNIWSTLATAEGGWGIEKTESFLRKLKEQYPIWAKSHGSARTLLIAGEFKIIAEELLPQFLVAQRKGAPIDWIRVKPVVVTGASMIMSKQAPHPDAARLFLEWLFSPQGLALFEKLSNKGLPYPGSGTQLSQLVEGLDLCVRTEEAILKAYELRLVERLANILGITGATDE